MAIHNAYKIRAGEVLYTKTGLKTKWTSETDSFVQKGKAYARVRCECGRIDNVRILAIRDGKSNGCAICSGVSKRCWPKIGDTAGLWTVIGVPTVVPKKHVKFKCQMSLWKN